MVSVAVVLAVFMLDVFRSLNNIDFNLRNVLITTMLGTNNDNISFMPWLGLTILYMIPLFFIGAVDSRIKKYGQSPILLRMKNMVEFDYRITGEYLKFIILYVFSIFVLTNVFYYLGEANNRYEDYLLYLSGVRFTNAILNMYIMIFLIYLLVDFILFKTLSKYCNSIVAFILILLCKFILFLIPSINYINFNFGMINLYNGSGISGDSLFKVIVLTILVGIYFIHSYIRRYRYGNR